MKGTKRKPADDSFTAFVIDQLSSLGTVEARSMFGGKGLYWKDQIFGLIDDGRLYFRVSEGTAGRYKLEGSKPFEPWPGHIMKGYYEVFLKRRAWAHQASCRGSRSRRGWRSPQSPHALVRSAL
jgi:TfoX/Sxy family transcriptional regulator of competence genes